MFSFHKPKIYRSNLGCCICKAKSSSSRFTDSKKYENEFERCFRIQEKRSGEICNACVLLVKRWKKLSPENKLTKHWHHVVDARAGPGTKLTGNRRLTNPSSHHNHHQSSSNDGLAAKQLGRSSGKVDVLPLSSSQANNQSGNGASSSTSKTRTTSSFSNKARAIDTNVSTFTFGEPLHRRNMSCEPSYSTVSSSSSFAKPQSALNSSAFESVIRRFRQRQQQQKIKAQRRQQNQQQRLQQRVSRQAPIDKKLHTQSKQNDSERDTGRQAETSSNSRTVEKRVKRSSESINSLTIDGLRVSSMLDASIWRKEKICCGYIFKGLYNEIAIFPKLLKPCQCRRDGASFNEIIDKQEVDDQGLLKRSTDSPPPRATKSGSISSCDSNTSGTGSMEQPLDESSVSGINPVKRPRTMPTGRRATRRQIGDTDSNTSSSSGTSTMMECKNSVQSPSSSSGTSSSRLVLMADDEDVDDDEEVEEEEELVLDEESSNDAASSVESLTGKNQSGAIAMG